MIKKFRDLSEKEQRKFLSEYFTVTEKLDMVFFKLSISDAGIFVLKPPKFTAVSDIDCICNSIYKDMVQFSKSFYKYKDYILENAGPCLIEVFYLPKHKTKVINYNTLPEKLFIISGITPPNKFGVVYDEFVSEIIDLINAEHEYKITHNAKISIMRKDESFINDVINAKSDLEAVEIIWSKLPENLSSSHLPVVEKEGIILRNKKGKQYQLIVNDTSVSINKESKKIYRDTVLSNLAKMLLYDVNYIKDLSDSKESYINKVSKLFLDFIHYTDIFSKYKFDAEDLLPPIDGYIGDIDLDSIETEDVKTICKSNPVYKNILRLFLHTFTNTVSTNKFQYLPEQDAKYLNELTIALKYKNYAEIARQHSL